MVRSRSAALQNLKKDVLRLFIVIMLLVVVGVRFERKAVSIAISVVLVFLFALLSRRTENRGDDGGSGR